MAPTVLLCLSRWHRNRCVGKLCDVNDGKLKRVLVIDDDELSREVLELLLSSEGYPVSVASSGDEALSSLDGMESRPEVILMDLQMPGISGLELARGLRAACGSSARVMVMSGSQPPVGGLAWADGFLLKPFSAGEFTAALGGSAGAAGGRKTESRGGGLEPLDGGTFAHLEGMIGGGALRQLYELCLGDAAKCLGEMRAAARDGDDEGLRRSAHSIKGSLGMVGAKELEGMCAELERYGTVGDYLATFQEFPEALGRLRRMLIARGVELNAQDPGA